MGTIVTALAMVALAALGYAITTEPPDARTGGDRSPAAQEPEPSLPGLVTGAPENPSLPPGPPPGNRSLDLSWEEECRWLGFDPTSSRAKASSLVDLHLDLDPSDLALLYERDPRSNDRLPAAYRLHDGVEGTSRGAAEVRFRGNSTRRVPKKSFQLRLDEAVPTLATDRVNLNAMWTDPSFVREHLAFRMFSDTGLAAPRTQYVDLHINGVYEGLYLYVQRVDERLLREHGLPHEDVSLIRDRARRSFEGNVSLFSGLPLPLDDRDALLDELPALFDARGTPDWEAVADLVTQVETRTHRPTLDEVDELFDIDQLVDFYTLHVLIGDVDAYTDDYWLYRPDGDAPWQFLPWDKDLSFGSHFVPGHGIANNLFHYEWPLLARATPRNGILDMVFTIPAVEERFHRRLAELSSTFDLDYVCEQLAAVAPVIANSAAREPGDGAFQRHSANHFAGPDDRELHLARVLDYVQLRGAFLDRKLNPVQGAPETASVEVSADDVGRSLLLTDSEGWTIARLDVLEVLRPGRVSIDVEPGTHPTAIDRVWNVDSGARLTGHLNFYYRNTAEFGDWYDSDDGVDPIGSQGNLHVYIVAPHEGLERLHTLANPSSNRVVTEVTLDGSTSYVLDLGERSG